ncbi:uncharacterized protein LAJ45_08380 [Morchella importuna]|uniref:uncharacterized protein n=1 Tax=Morchella importuna TaxID=1174673 RepID=UPI001E8CD2A3|nr:uncharacterized protein LAJ45_08380 [Morchella importuna]KAH8147553.1 hypothetical protein LAJ45_08380 [Morchella importuna]
MTHPHPPRPLKDTHIKTPDFLYLFTTLSVSPAPPKWPPPPAQQSNSPQSKPTTNGHPYAPRPAPPLSSPPLPFPSSPQLFQPKLTPPPDLRPRRQHPPTARRPRLHHHNPPLLLSHPPTHLLDLGCGTGRNTSKLHALLPPTSHITALDASPAMMSIAQSRLPSPRITWVLHDLTRNTPLPVTAPVDAVVSTLVLEHVGLDVFFGAVAGVLRSGGWAYVTSMHPQMGAVSRAGFVDERGVKVQGVSYNHQVEEVVASAERAGLRLQGEVGERGVGDEGEVEGLGVRARKWVGVVMHVEMVFFKV